MKERERERVMTDLLRITTTTDTCHQWRLACTHLAARVTATTTRRNARATRNRTETRGTTATERRPPNSESIVHQLFIILFWLNSSQNLTCSLSQLTFGRRSRRSASDHRRHPARSPWTSRTIGKKRHPAAAHLLLMSLRAALAVLCVSGAGIGSMRIAL